MKIYSTFKLFGLRRRKGIVISRDLVACHFRFLNHKSVCHDCLHSFFRVQEMDMPIKLRGLSVKSLSTSNDRVKKTHTETHMSIKVIWGHSNILKKNYYIDLLLLEKDGWRFSNRHLNYLAVHTQYFFSTIFIEKLCVEDHQRNRNLQLFSWNYPWFRETLPVYKT